MNAQELLNSIPQEVLNLRASGQLHKVAEARTGTTDFGLDTAVAALAKKAYYMRHVNKAIAAGINAVDNIR